MPKVEKRVARKDYPESGIAKGDTYYFTKMKTGPRSSRTMRSKTPFKASQLTSSAFKSAYLAAQEAWDDGDKDADAMRSAAEAIREAGQEAQNAFDNMPEGLQQGDTGQMLEERANYCESAADSLEGLADELDGLEEPEEPEGYDEDIAPEDKSDEWIEYEESRDDFIDARERIMSEADELIGDMPE